LGEKMKDKVEFVSDVFGFPPIVLEATTWEEVASELDDKGYVNMGKVKVVKRTYQWVSDEPQLIDTDYSAEDDEPAPFQAGDRVYVAPAKMEATVIRQIKHYDMGESFWGDLELQYDDGVKGRSHCWQVKKIRPCTCHPDDNPPVPCARQYALSECRRSIA